MTPEPGRYRVDRTPYLRGILDAITDPHVYRVVVMSCAQIAKTDGIILNTAGYYSHQDPSPMIMVFPREVDARRLSITRLAGMYRESPELAGILADDKTRSSGNQQLLKYFPGGRIVLVGANAPQNLAGEPIRIILGDEVDRWPISAGKEGDPVTLVVRRAATYSNSVQVFTSTPTDAEVSRIDSMYRESDQRAFYCPCPHCGDFQVLEWENVKWSRDEDGEWLVETAKYHCEHCDAPWTEGERHQAVKQGDWDARAEFDGVAGFWIGGLYSPWPNMRLTKLVGEFREAQGRPMQLRAFRNTVEGKVWHAKFIQNPGDLTSHKSHYPERNGRVVMPKEALIPVASVDVQDDRLEFFVTAFGREFEEWAWGRWKIYGDPGENKVWEDLWELMNQPIEWETGEVKYIQATAIDTGGHHTLRAYEFCRPRFLRQMPNGMPSYVFAIKGSGGRQGTIWPTAPSTNNLGHVRLYNILVDPAKDALNTSLTKIMEPGPGYIHWPMTPAFGLEFDAEYFAELTAERCAVDADINGFEKRVWQKKQEHLANEALDLHNYALAALYGLMNMSNAPLLQMAAVIDEKKTAERLRAGDDGERGVSGKKDPNDPSSPAQPARHHKRRRARSVSPSPYMR